MLLEWGLEREAAPLPPSPEVSKVPKAPKAKGLRPEDALWESLYEQHGSPELHQEFLSSPYFSVLPQLSAERKLELLIHNMQVTLAFS